MQQEFQDLLADAALETGIAITTDLNEVTTYAAERAAHLATLVGQPGFQEAVRVERQNVAAKAAINATDAAEAADIRMVGVIQGALAMAAKALAVTLVAEAATGETETEGPDSTPA